MIKLQTKSVSVAIFSVFHLIVCLLDDFICLLVTNMKKGYPQNVYTLFCIIIDRFYEALTSTLEKTDCASRCL